MSKKRHKPEEIVSKLRQVDVLTSQGKDCCRSHSIDRVSCLYSMLKPSCTIARNHHAAAPVCATQTSSAGRLRLGKQPCLKLTFNWTTFWGQIIVPRIAHYYGSENDKASRNGLAALNS